MSAIQQSAVRNGLLAILPPENFAALAPNLRPVELEFRQALYEPGQRIRSAYFLERGMISQIAPLEEGHNVEVGIIGREGLAGVSVILGGERATTEAMVQMEGSALRIGVEELHAAFDQMAPLRRVLLRYVQASHLQIAQTAACNARHKVDERLARWLLMAHDRAEQDEFPMTHEFLALMLAARRASISVAASVLQKAGVISYTHGHMAVHDRAGLEAASCECYAIVREQCDVLLGGGASGGSQQPAAC